MELDIELANKVKDEIEKKFEGMGHVNILIAGKTGVGKSTLINSVFHGNYATTGHGKPVTKDTRKITKPDSFLSIYDTRGLEVAEYKETLEELKSLIFKTNRNTEPNEHIHVGWVCIGENSRRVEDAEIELVNALSEYMPVVGVITKAISDQGFKAEVQKILPNTKNVVRVLGESIIYDDGHTTKQHGLDDLVNLTHSLIPESQKKAFAASQQVSLELKAERAHLAVLSAAGIAGASVFNPIPFSDAFTIVPIQIGMIVTISHIFGLNVSTGFVSTFIASTFTAVGGTLGGRALVGQLFKFFPGVGTAVGGAINAGIATTLTTTFGQAYIQALQILLQNTRPEEVTAEAIGESFKECLGVAEGNSSSGIRNWIANKISF